MTDNREKLDRAAALAAECSEHLREVRFEDAVRCAQEALYLKTEVHGEMSPECMDAYGLAGLACSISAFRTAGSTQLGEERLAASDKQFAMSLYYYDTALEIAKNTFGEESAQAARIYGNMGSVYRLMDDDWQEEEYYIHAIGIYSGLAERIKEEYGEFSKELAEIYENLSTIYKNMDCTNEMMLYIERAEKIYDKPDGEHGEECGCGHEHEHEHGEGCGCGHEHEHEHEH